MKKKFQLIFGMLFAWLAAGCSTNQEGIEFISDEQFKSVVNPAQTVAALSHPHLAKEDLFKIQVAIYGSLLQRHFPEAGEYSAVFVEGDDAEVAALIKQFPSHVPPIKPSDQADLRPDRAPVDKQTGKPAMIFSVDAIRQEEDTVQAIGRWYAGGAISGFSTFVLRKAGGEWVVESAK